MTLKPARTQLAEFMAKYTPQIAAEGRAVAATCLAWLPAAACFYLASRTLRQDIAAANAPT